MNKIILLLALVLSNVIYIFSQKNSDYTLSIRSSDNNGITTTISDNKFMPGDFEISFQSKDMFNTSKFAVEITGVQFTSFSKYFNIIEVRPELTKFVTKAKITEEGNYIIRVMLATTTWNSNTLDAKTTFDTLITKEFNVIPAGVYFCRSVDNTNTEKGISVSGCGDIYIMVNNTGKKIDLCYMVIYELLPGREKGLFGMYELKNITHGINSAGKYNFPCNGASEYIITFKLKKDSDNYFWERTFY